MLEKILFQELVLPGELIRIAFALLGLLITSYYDLFNNKNIPEKVLFSFLGISLILNLYFYEPDLSIFAVILSIIIGAIGYFFHRLGQLGSADVIVLSAIALLLPIHPSFSQMQINYPFILSLIVFSGVLFALYSTINFGIKLLKKKKTNPNLFSLIIIVPYILFLYMYLQIPFLTMSYLAIVSIVVLSSLLFLTFKEDINRMLVEKVPLGKAEEEDVVALEFMDKKLLEKYKIERVLTEKELKRLKKFKIKEIWIYKHLPPFLPFLLVAFVLSLFYSNLLLS